MEDILDIYEISYNPLRPVICMDEKPYQLPGESREPLLMRKGSELKTDSEYIRKGTCSIFVFTEPLGGVRHVSVKEQRTAVDWAKEIKYLADVCYPDAEKIVLVLDNLNTHTLGSLYKTFPAAEARRLARRFEMHFTPKHGSWLNIAEVELNVMTKQCLSRRVESINKLKTELLAWESKRNNDSSKINWHFTNNHARSKLISLYPKLIPLDS
jgi:hypothetical protein